MVLTWTPNTCPTPGVEWASNSATPVDSEVMWPLNLSCCKALDLVPAPPESLVLRASAAASQALFDKTCRKYRLCYQELRPCNVCDCGGACSGECSLRALNLRSLLGVNANIVQIGDVKIDGVVVPDTEYWLEQNRYLVPLRNGLLWQWPVQDLHLPTAAVGTWSVGVYYGTLVPELLLIAAEDLACQLITRCMGQPCDIPENAISVTREGVTIRLETGLSALPTVKEALEIYGKCAERTRILDPARRRSGTVGNLY